MATHDYKHLTIAVAISPSAMSEDRALSVRTYIEMA